MPVSERQSAHRRATQAAQWVPASRSGLSSRTPEGGRPWEAQFSDPKDISKVRRTVGEHFARDVYWIPGVVLVPVRQQSDFDEALAELRAALGDEGLSTGLLLLFPGCTRPINLTREMRAFGRIKIQTADERLLNLYRGKLEDLVESVAGATLAKLGKESAAWLEERVRRSALDLNSDRH